MNYQALRQSAEKWCDAWTNRDLDSVMEHYTEDVRFSSPTVINRLGIKSGWIEGKARLREHFAVGIQAPNIRFELINVLLGVDGICILYRRETGAIALDVIELGDRCKGKVARALYRWRSNNKIRISRNIKDRA